MAQPALVLREELALAGSRPEEVVGMATAPQQEVRVMIRMVVVAHCLLVEAQVAAVVVEICAHR